MVYFVACTMSRLRHSGSSREGASFDLRGTLGQSLLYAHHHCYHSPVLLSHLMCEASTPPIGPKGLAL